MMTGQTIAASIVVGSRAFGTHTKDSDTDTMTIYMPTADQLLGMKKFRREGGDRSYYVLPDVVHLLRKGSFNLFEVLWLPAHEQNDFWKLLVEIKKVFLTERTLSSAYGFVNGNVHGLKKTHPKVWDVREYKKASQCYRVAIELRQLIHHFNLTFPLNPEDVAIIHSIKHGDYSPDKVLDEIEEAISVKYSHEEGAGFPPEADYGTIFDYLCDLYSHVLDA